MEWLLFLLTIGGGVLLSAGLRGRIVGDAPHCAACGFDLTGVPGRVDGHRPKSRCPECGQAITSPDQVRTGRRVRRRWMIAAGSAMLVLWPLSIAAVQIPAVSGFRWIEHKPGGVAAARRDRGVRGRARRPPLAAARPGRLVP